MTQKKKGSIELLCISFSFVSWLLSGHQIQQLAKEQQFLNSYQSEALSEARFLKGGAYFGLSKLIDFGLKNLKGFEHIHHS